MFDYLHLPNSESIFLKKKKEKEQDYNLVCMCSVIILVD